jgi:hypothetical protein
MMIATAQISESLQTLIDSRLDTIDRMLLGRLSRQERLAIVTEVESQIHELLHASDADELTREDVLAVLARLDPPEAYISDEVDGERVSQRRTRPTRAYQAVPTADKVGRASGILGVLALALMLLLPLEYLLGYAVHSELAVEIPLIGTLLLMLIGAILGLAFGIIARKSGPSAVVGIVTSSLSLFLTLTIVIIGILLL